MLTYLRHCMDNFYTCGNTLWRHFMHCKVCRNIATLSYRQNVVICTVNVLYLIQYIFSAILCRRLQHYTLYHSVKTFSFSKACQNVFSYGIAWLITYPKCFMVCCQNADILGTVVNMVYFYKCTNVRTQ